MADMRSAFVSTAESLLDNDPLVAVVLAEISADLFAKAAARHPDGAVVMVEPYLAGTSARVVSAALSGRPSRQLHLGVPRTELRRYGTPEDHARLYGLDPAGIRRSVAEFLAGG